MASAEVLFSGSCTLTSQILSAEVTIFAVAECQENRTFIPLCLTCSYMARWSSLLQVLSLCFLPPYLSKTRPGS